MSYLFTPSQLAVYDAKKLLALRDLLHENDPNPGTVSAVVKKIQAKIGYHQPVGDEVQFLVDYYKAATAPRAPAKRSGSALFGFLIIAAFLGFVGYGAVSVASVHKTVEDDVTEQYKLTQKYGDKSDRCVHAMIAAEAALQAHDEAGYAHWQLAKQGDCK